MNPQRQFFLRDILMVLFKYKLLIILFPMLVFLLVFIGNYIWPPTFESESKVRIIRGREMSQTDPTVIQTAQSMTMISMGMEDMRSEIELIHSRDLLRNIVESLNLHENPRFPHGDSSFQKPFRITRSALNQLLYSLKIVSPPSGIERAMDDLEKAILAEPVRDSWVIHIGVRLGDRDLAQDVLSKLLDEYKRLHIEVFSSPESAKFFQEQKERVSLELREAQNEREVFRKQHNVSILDNEKSLLLEEYTNGARLLLQLEESSALLDSGAVDSEIISDLSMRTDSLVVREMQLRLLELLLEQSRLVRTMGQRHPQVQSINEQVQTAQNRLKSAIESTRENTRKRQDILENRLIVLNDIMEQLERIDQEVSILSELYEFYAQKLEESIVADRMAEHQVSSVKIASNPTLPLNPVRPNKLLNLALALVGGVIGALTLAFFLDYLDHGLKTPEDVEHYLKVPLLASFFNTRNNILNPGEVERLAMILDADHKQGSAHWIEVTSAVNGENASLVAKALAECFAHNTSQKVLLLDFDSKTTQNTTGVIDLLTGKILIDAFINEASNITNIAKGSDTEETSSYLWRSEAMKNLAAELRTKFDYIILLVPPVLSSHDAPQLAVHVDDVLIVIKADATRREVVQRALDYFGEHSNRISTVLTERNQTIPQAVYRHI